MKLLHRTGYYYLLLSLLVFCIGGLVMFFALRLVLDSEADESLVNTRAALKDYLLGLDTLPARLRILNEDVALRPFDSTDEYDFFADTLYYDTIDKEYKPYRKFTFVETIGSRTYLISLHQSKVESEDLITTILLTTLGILGFLLVTLNLLNRFLSRHLWEPFYQIIQQMQAFAVQNDEKLRFSPTQTDEFVQLQQSLERMTTKLQKDYRSLRRFTENASHELQTPLAVMRSQVDLLLQDTDRSPADYESIRHLSEAISRLRRLHQALLMLTRMENDQFRNTELIDFQFLLTKKVANIQPLLAEKGIFLKSTLHACMLESNPLLTDILFNNLLENAIKHNLANGKITLSLFPDKFIIGNTGKALHRPTAELFERFTKGEADNQSLGLGLAIVHEICMINSWPISYNVNQIWHEITIHFKAA